MLGIPTQRRKTTGLERNSWEETLNCQENHTMLQGETPFTNLKKNKRHSTPRWTGVHTWWQSKVHDREFNGLWPARAFYSVCRNVPV
jgi:hypothetical protein